MRQFHSTRLVWDAITRNPAASTRELAEQTSLPMQTIANALAALEAAGHISHASGQSRARTVNVPFRIQENLQ